MRAISAGASVDGWRTERCGARAWPVTWQARRSDTGDWVVRGGRRPAPRGRAQKFPRGDVPHHRGVQRLVGHQPREPAVLPLEPLQPFGLIPPPPAGLPAPAVIRRLADPERPHHRPHRLPLRQGHLRLPQVADDLLSRVPLACHAGSPRPARILSQDLDQF